MANKSNEDGVIVALLDRFRTQRLPRAMEIQEKVNSGGKLSETDIGFLKQVFDDATQIKPILDRHPDYEELVAKAMHLYNQITKQALDNEQS